MKKLGVVFFSCGILLAIVVLCAMSLSKTGDTWWYVHGVPSYWHYQSDVYAFRTIDGSGWEPSFENECIRHVIHRGKYHDKLNIIYFKPGCLDADITAIKNIIRADSLFEVEFPVITQYPHLTYASAAWFAIDDLLLVNFNPDSLNEPRFLKFKQDYNLKQINFPDSIFPEGIFTYVFEFDANEIQPGSGIELARTIYVSDSGFVMNIQPNLINAYEEVGGETPVAAGSDVFSDGNDNIECYVVNVDNASVALHIGKNPALENSVVKVYDLFGRIMKVFKVEPGRYEYEINISDYAGGIYFAGMEDELERVMVVRKFVKL